MASTYFDGRDFFERSAPDEWIPPEVAQQIIGAIQGEMNDGSFDPAAWQEKFDGYTEAVCARMGLDEDGCDDEGNPFDAHSISAALEGEVEVDTSFALENGGDPDSYTPEWVAESDADYLASLEDDNLSEMELMD